MKPIRPVKRGDGQRTMMHASLANEVIAALNAMLAVRVEPPTAGRAHFAEAGLVLELYAAETAATGTDIVAGDGIAVSVDEETGETLVSLDLVSSDSRVILTTAPSGQVSISLAPGFSGTTLESSDGSIDISEAPAGTFDIIVADDKIDTRHLKALAVTTAKLADLAVTTGKLAADAVTSAKLADNSVGPSHLQDDAVLNVAIADNAVDGRTIADDAISPNHIQDDAVQNVAIADDAVDGRTIAPLAVAEEHIGTGAVTEDKIYNGAVTEEKIGDGEVTMAKINQAGATPGQGIKWNGTAWAPGTFAGGGLTNGDKGDITVALDGDSLTIDAGAVLEAKIGTGAVTTDKLGPLAVTGAKIENDTIPFSKLQGLAKVQMQVKLADGSCVTRWVVVEA